MAGIDKLGAELAHANDSDAGIPLDTYFDLISQWGIDRNITAEGGATVMAQMSKMTEEFAEFLGTWAKVETCALEVGDALDYVDTVVEAPQYAYERALKESIEDDFGDMLVCLIQAMRLAGTDMRTCLAKAWDDIKDRKGRMENGKFVKEP